MLATQKMTTRLTKTAYLRYLKCPQEFWLEHHQPLLFGAEPVTLEYQHLRQQGYEVESYVKKLAQFQPDDTKSVDFQFDFHTAELFAKSDVVVTDKATGERRIYEIKGAASVKEEHYDDVAFQKMVAEKSGATVGRCYVITMNGEYVRRGDIDAEQLFTITDVTEKVAERMSLTEQQAIAARAYLESEPIPSLLDYCAENKLDCFFIKLHFPDLPDYTIFDITYLKNEKRRELLEQNIIAITDVPDNFPLSDKQRKQVAAAKSGEVVIEHDEIKKRMDAWEYPLHFLDYETFSYAIPQFDGVRPFQQMCFQYSLHTIDAPGGEMRQSGYLARNGEANPPLKLAEHMRQAMSGGIGTVFVWYEAFEKTRNTEMAGMFPEYADFFNEVNAKTVDLMKIFADRLYIHPEFKGRSSIKKVLPVLVPELKYSDLGISEGLTASISWYRAAKWDTIDEQTRAQIFADLEKYCELDTLAMVEIYRVLAAL
ncbi:MAG: DUF2779 domain-containing protein [Pyrinomonadaceae bacterium]